MAQKIATKKVRVLRSFYTHDLQPDGTFSKTTSLKQGGAVIVMKLKDAIEARTANKVEFYKETAAVLPPKDPEKASLLKDEKKEGRGSREEARTKALRGGHGH